MHRHLPDYPGPSMRDYYEFGDPDDMMRCDCGHEDFDEEVIEVNGKTFCCNCKPTLEDKLNDWLDRFVAWIEGWFK